jgi:Escherichia/Staphylococcus phage prohead protease
MFAILRASLRSKTSPPHKAMEHRAIIELRSEGRKLLGYAAKFGVEARIADFTESIRAGAFAASLRSGADVLALVDHDATKVLARTKSGNLKLAEDATGLAFELSVPDTQAGRDVLALAERGDLGGMSFGFIVPKDGDRWQGNKRELVAVDLREVSVVSAWPAYPQTTVAARMRTPRLNLALRYLESCRWD